VVTRDSEDAVLQPDCPDIPQFVTSEQCLRCEVCCRFSGTASDMAPVFSPREAAAALAAGLDAAAFCGAESPMAERAVLVQDDLGAKCPAFDRKANACRFYEQRPLDCRLYPLVLMYDADGGQVLLAADVACPVVERHAGTQRLAEYVRQVSELLEGRLSDQCWESRGAVGEFKPWMLHPVPLPRLSRRVCRTDLGLRRLVLSAAVELEPFFGAEPAALATHALAPVRVWSGLFDLYWAVSGERLILAAAGNGPAFLMAPPLGRGPLQPAVQRGVELLRALNPPHAAARVQEVPEPLRPEFEAMGFRTTQVFHEYLYDRARLASLAGNAYKGKRSARNCFAKHHSASFRPFQEDDLPDCWELYRRWWRERAAADSSVMFASQLQASASMFLAALREREALGLRVRVLEADGRIAACTAGYEAPGGGQFAVLIEVADRAVKGAAAFCFQEFCREAAPLPLINAMSDSGLAGLAAAKESYHPVRREPSLVMEAPPA